MRATHLRNPLDGISCNLDVATVDDEKSIAQGPTLWGAGEGEGLVSHGWSARKTWGSDSPPRWINRRGAIVRVLSICHIAVWLCCHPYFKKARAASGFVCPARPFGSH